MDVMTMTFGSNESFLAAQNALAQLIGEEAKNLEWISRVVSRGDAFKIRVMYPEVNLRALPDQYKSLCCDDETRFFSSPWLCPETLRGVLVKELDLAEGVELLRSPENPELELLRRREAVRINDEKIEAAKLAAIAKAKADDAHEAEQRRLDIEFRAKEWNELTPQAQVFFQIAMAIDDGLLWDELGAELRSLAAATGKGGGLRAPRRIWWAA